MPVVQRWVEETMRRLIDVHSNGEIICENVASKFVVDCRALRDSPGDKNQAGRARCSQ